MHAPPAGRACRTNAGNPRLRPAPPHPSKVPRQTADSMSLRLSLPTRALLPALLLLVATALLPAASVLPTGPAELAALRAAAERGDRAAQHHLGLVCADPSEPAYNPVEAYVWLTLSTDADNAGGTLATVRAGLTPSQLAAAQRLLATRGRADPAQPVAAGSGANPASPSGSAPAATKPGVETTDPARLRTQVATTEQENERLRAALAEHKLRLDLREEDLATLGRQLASTLPSFAPTTATPDANTASTALRAERDRLDTQLSAERTARATLQRQLDDAGARLLAAQRELAARPADSALKSLTAERDAFKDRAAAQQVRLDQLAASLAASETQLVQAREKAAAPPPESPALTQRLADAEEKLTASLRAYSLQQGEIDRLQKALASLDDERAVLAGQLASAQAELAATRAAGTAERASLATTALVTANQEAETLRASLAAAARANDENRAALDAARENLAAQQQQFAGLSAARERELDTLRAQLRLAQAGTAAAPAAPNLPPADALAPRIHTVVAGDTLGKIARQYYGAAARWPEILEANRDRVKNPDLLPLGAKLQIP